MSSFNNGSRADLSETLQQALIGIAKFLMWVGGAMCLGALGFLIFTCVKFADPASLTSAVGIAARANDNIEIFRKILNLGSIAMMVGTTYLFWGEEVLGVLQLVYAGILYFAPIYLPAVLGMKDTIPQPAVNAMAVMQTCGMLFGLLALGVMVADITVRIRQRVQQGVRVDQLKYGKGIKEERDRRNVFLGKCWQLPYCRKFVREACPIFHAGRTCWKERTGCMCEEEVIRGAMQNKTIPKDSLTAAQYIPRNNKLTMAQKQERCRSCVIYNEHQKHKYKAWLYGTLAGFVIFYAVGRGLLINGTQSVINALDRVISLATLGGGNLTTSIKDSPLPLAELLLVCFMVVALAYTLKIIEYLIFKVKI